MSLRIIFFDVGNADCIVIWPGHSSASAVDVPKWRQLERWLKGKKITELFDIFITHEHKDHLEPMENLVGFIEEWLKAGKSRRIGRLFMSYDAYQVAVGRLKAMPRGTPELERQFERRKAVIERLKSLYERRELEVQPGTASKFPIARPDFAVTILHPSISFEQSKPNEACLVLRVTHGAFSAILLGDLAGAGLVECAKLAQAWPEAFRSTLVKIPHHGAWPSSEAAALESLLRSIAAKQAILSVGSKNNYGHVAPELFNLLRSLHGEGSGLRFICTQQTLTCTQGAAKRKTIGKQGLEKVVPCAGEIMVVAEEDGSFSMETQQKEHKQIVSLTPYAACQGRMNS